MTLKTFRNLCILIVIILLMLPASVSAEQDPFTIQGMVFNDMNQDGVFDVGEEGIENVLVELWISGELSASTFTDPNGYFEFTELTVGSYSVVEIDKADFLSTTANEINIEVDGTSIIPTIHFGDVPMEALASIFGTVYDDVNKNRVLDPGEPGLEGVSVHLMDSQGVFIERVITDENGEYSFGRLWAGTYSVREENPQGYYSTTPQEITLALYVGEIRTNVNFGDFIPEPGSLSPIDPLISEFFDLPVLDILDLRAIQKMGYGNISKVYFAAKLSGEPVSAILDLIKTEGGWGNALRMVVGFPSLKGNNLGKIISGREDAVHVELLLDGCPIVQTQDQMQALMATGVSQGEIKKTCRMVMETGGDYEALTNAVNMRNDQVKWNDIQETLQNPNGESQETPVEHGPPACKGKNKDDPGCEK